jgi:hypothetical protein
VGNCLTMACATEITPQSGVDPPVTDKRPNGPFTVHACSPSDASVSPARHFACASDEQQSSVLGHARLLLRHGEAGVIVSSAKPLKQAPRRAKCYPNLLPRGDPSQTLKPRKQRKGPEIRAFSVIAGAGFEPATFGL